MQLWLTTGNVDMDQLLDMYFLVVMNSGLHLEPLHLYFFVLGFFEIGSGELFSWAGFEP
jgi:hypothetical protein